MRKIMIGLLLVCSMALPMAAFAQDVPTPEGFETATAIAEEPTLVPTVEPTPIPAPSPIDETKIPTWLGVVAVVLVVGIVSISIVGIMQAAKGLPSWARELILAGVGSGLDSVDTYVKGTETTIDDMAVNELRKLVEQLRRELAETNVKVTANTQNIQATQQAIRSQNS